MDERKIHMKRLTPHISIRIVLVHILTVLPAIYVASPLPAQAFPCNKASTKVERTICANPELKQADDAMERAYFAMRDNLAQRDVGMLRTSQRNWLKYRNITCLAEPNCLRAETQNRTGILNEISRYLPALVPVFMWQLGGKNAYALKFDGVKFAPPATGSQTAGRSAFNREVDRIIADAPWGEKTEDQNISSWENETTLRVNRLTSRMISATASIYDYSGGAHPNSWSTSININLQTGRPLKTGDLFSEKSIDALINDCRDKIIEAKSDWYDGNLEQARADIEETYPNAVRKHVLDMAMWRFTDKGAAINFNSYDIGPYAAGPYSCEFSSEYIKKLIRKPELLEK